jgi:hypothetical protein
VLGCSSSEWYVKCFQVLYYNYYYATTTAIYSDILGDSARERDALDAVAELDLQTYMVFCGSPVES